MMITHFVPGHTYRYVGKKVSKDALNSLPALSGESVVCLNALGDCATFDCDLSPAMLAKYDLGSWIRIESKEEKGFILPDSFIPKPGMIDDGLYTIWNVSGLSLADRVCSIQQRIRRKMQETFPENQVTRVDGTTILRFTEMSIYELLKEGKVLLSDVLCLATIQEATSIQTYLAERSSGSSFVRN